MTELSQAMEAERVAVAPLSKPHLRGVAGSLRELVYLLRADLYRYAGKVDLWSFVKHVTFTPGYKYSTCMRICGYLRRRRWTRYTLFVPAKLLLLHYRYKYGIAIPEYTKIGPGLFINRFGNIMVNGDAVIGANFNITHGAMLGQMNRGPRKGSPIVGDRVYLAAGCKVIGGIHLGDDVAVGANAVVTKDVPPMGVVVGIPGKVISQDGSSAYVNRIVDAR